MYPAGQSILVIDNDAARRRSVEQILAAEGFTVTAVGEGLSALRAAQQERFALAIAALGLPGTLDGVATVRQARSRQPWLRALFVVAPGEAPRRDSPDRDDTITAPLVRHELLGCVFELLQRETFPGADLARRWRVELHAS